MFLWEDNIYCQELIVIGIIPGSDILSQGVKYNVCKIVTHERYRGDDEVHFYFYDIGLLLLSRNIRFGPTVRKVEIAPNSYFRNAKYSFTLAGFGAITVSKRKNRK